jgi:hypothetical protein
MNFKHLVILSTALSTPAYANECKMPPGEMVTPKDCRMCVITTENLHGRIMAFLCQPVSPPTCSAICPAAYLSCLAIGPASVQNRMLTSRGIAANIAKLPGLLQRS